MKCLFLPGPHSHPQAVKAKTTEVPFDNLILQFMASFIVRAQYTLFENDSQGL